MGRLHHYSTTGGVCLLMGAFCGGFDGCGLNNPSGLLPRQAFGRQATVSAAQGKRRLGQEMPRTMGHFQARKWQKAHRALCKKAFARPLHRGGYREDDSFRPFGAPPSEREARGIAKLRQLLPQSCRLGKPSDGKTAPSEKAPIIWNCTEFRKHLLAPGETPIIWNLADQENICSFSKRRLNCGFNNPSVRLVPRLTPPSYIGLPQRFCEAKDLWEEEQRASEQSRE